MHVKLKKYFAELLCNSETKSLFPPQKHSYVLKTDLAEKWPSHPAGNCNFRTFMTFQIGTSQTSEGSENGNILVGELSTSSCPHSSVGKGTEPAGRMQSWMQTPRESPLWSWQDVQGRQRAGTAPRLTMPLRPQRGAHPGAGKATSPWQGWL